MDIGDFNLSVWKGGYPVWVEITYGGNTFKMRHDELRYLKFAVEEAMAQARRELPDQYKDEV